MHSQPYCVPTLALRAYVGIALHKCREKILDMYKFTDPLTFKISGSLFINIFLLSYKRLYQVPT